MKKIAHVSILAASMALSAAAMADGMTSQGFYVGGGYTDTEVELDGLGSDADVGVLFARGGYQFNQNVALEARLGLFTDDDKIDGWKVDLEEIYGAYLKAGLPTQIGLYPYVLLGLTHAEVEVSRRGVSASDSDTDISYGIGADYWFNQQVSAGLEFTHYYDKGGDEIGGITLGLNYKF